MAKASSHEQDLRLSKVYEQLVQGMPTRAILRYASEKWGVSTRTGEYLIAKARQQLLLTLEAERNESLALELATRNELLRLALEAGKLQTALAIADSRAKLRGLFDRQDQKVSDEIIQIIGTYDVEVC